MYDYGMIGIWRGLRNFVVMFPESVIGASAGLTQPCLTYVLMAAAQGDGVNFLLFAWNEFLFVFNSAANWNPVVVHLLTELLKTHAARENNIRVEL
uniref:Uncharacterized protein n=1 Tax=Ixodes ricinus TaxID=34613 RepID=A0A6B0UDF5_IXORI